MTGGGSGGHITPLLSLAHALKEAEPECRIIYIGLKGETLEDSLRKRYQIFDEVRAIPSGKFRRYHGESLLAHLVDVRTLTLNLRDFFRVMRGIVSARRLLKRAKPDAVFSKGGFVAVPVGIAAKLQGIPIVTHDSDTIPGLANRIVGRYASVHTTGMPSEHYPKESTRYVGIPLDGRIKPVTTAMQQEFKKQLGLPGDSLVLLIGGAGLGARDVNNATIQIAPELTDKFKDLRIVHFSGQKHEAEVSEKYQTVVPEANSRIMVLGFSPDFYKYSGAADLVITRAGATTIAELAAQKKAVVLIPAPHLTGGHQVKNAEQLQKTGAAEIVSSDAPPSRLLKVVESLLANKHRRQEMAEKLGMMAKPEAADELAKVLLDVANKSEPAAQNVS